MLAVALSFDALGDPVPQGSHRSPAAGIVIESNNAVGPWREAVAWQARKAQGAGWEPLAGSLAVSLVFRLRKPSSYPKRVVYPTRKPDLDKLVRAVFDSLTIARTWLDDAQVIELAAAKRYADPAEVAGVTITLREVRP